MVFRSSSYLVWFSTYSFLRFVARLVYPYIVYIYGPFHALRVFHSYAETVISQKLLGVERWSTYQKKDLIEHYKIRLFLKLYFNHGLSYRPRKSPLRVFRTILTFFTVWLWYKFSANWFKIAQYLFHGIKYKPFYVFKWKN